MRSIIAQSWRQAAVVALLVGLDLDVSLPIMGTTYRPFSWMSITPAGAATLYPAIRSMTFPDGKPELAVETSPGANCALQRSTNLLDQVGWTDVATTTALGPLIYLADTNPVAQAVYYRVKRVFGSP